MNQPNKYPTQNIGGWSIPKMIRAIRTQFKKSVESARVKALAEQLRGQTERQSAFNVWAWIKDDNNVLYVRDAKTIDQVQTADVTIDRRAGDCEDMTILGGALLHNMGIPIRAYIIAQNGGDWSHIFLTAGNAKSSHQFKGYAIDPVPPLTRFDQVASNITKTMEVQLIGGLAGVGSSTIAGFGSIMDATPATQALMAQRSALLDLSRKESNATRRAQLAREIRKLQSLILMNGMDEQAELSTVMPYVYDVSNNGRGNLKFLPNAPIEAIAQTLKEAAEDLDSPELAGLGDLGRARRRVRRRIRRKRLQANAAKEKKNAPPTKTKQRGRFREKMKKVGSFIRRFNPGSVAIRGGLILAMKMNMFSLATRFLPAVLPESKQAGVQITPDLMASWGKVKSLWKKLGGKEEKLKAAIISGAERSLRRRGSLNGLGEPVTAAAGTAAASGIIAKIKAFISKINFKKIFSRANKSKLLQIVQGKGGGATSDKEVGMGPIRDLFRPAGRPAQQQARPAKPQNPFLRTKEEMRSGVTAEQKRQQVLQQQAAQRTEELEQSGEGFQEGEQEQFENLMRRNRSREIPGSDQEGDDKKDNKTLLFVAAGIGAVALLMLR